MKNKYICITPFFPSKHSCEGIFIYDQILEIKKQTNLDILIIKLSSIYKNEDSYKYKGITVHIFKLLDLPRFYFAGLFSEINGKRFYFFLKKITNINSITHIHGHVNYPSAFLISYLKKKISFFSIIQHHGLDVYQKRHFNFFQRIFYNVYFHPNSVKILNELDLVVGVSNKVLESLKKSKNYLPKRELVVYNGVDKSKFYKLTTNQNKNKFVIGCIGNFWITKGQKVLINAVDILLKNHFDNIEIKFVGKGKNLNYIKNYVKDLKLDNYINFKEYIEHHNLNQFYNSIDIFVLPSYYEALGCVYMEAWSTETPFIGIENQGISELLNEKQKVKMLSKEKDAADLSEKIFFFYNNRSYTNEFNSKFYLNNTIKNFLKNINLRNE